MFDVGPVSFPAYSETTVSARSALAARGEGDDDGQPDAGNDADALRVEIARALDDAAMVRGVLRAEREAHRRDLARAVELGEIRKRRADDAEARLRALDRLAAG